MISRPYFGRSLKIISCHLGNRQTTLSTKSHGCAVVTTRPGKDKVMGRHTERCFFMEKEQTNRSLANFYTPDCCKPPYSHTQLCGRSFSSILGPPGTREISHSRWVPPPCVHHDPPCVHQVREHSSELLLHLYEVRVGLPRTSHNRFQLDPPRGAAEAVSSTGGTAGGGN